MSNIYDGAIDAALGNISTPPPAASPERAAKAQRLAFDSGVPADVIDLDPENWQLKYQTEKNARAIETTPELQDYLLKNDLNKKISSDDLLALKKVAEKARGSLPVIKPSEGDWRHLVFHAGQDPYEVVEPAAPTPPSPPKPFVEGLPGYAPTQTIISTKPISEVGKAAVEAFMNTPSVMRPGQGGPGMQGFEALLRPFAGAVDLLNASIAAGGAGFSEAVGQAVKMVNDVAESGVAGDPEAAKREAANFFNWLLIERGMVQGGRPAGEIPGRLADNPIVQEYLRTGKLPFPLTPKVYNFLKLADELRAARVEDTPVSPVAAWARTFEYKALPSPEMVSPSAREAVKNVVDDATAEVAKAEAPAEPGGPPPTPLSPVEVDAIAQQGVLNSLVKSANETATKTRSPSAFTDFTESAAKDATVSVPVTAVERLYNEKGVTPAPGDGILGYVPDIVRQVEVAKQTGGDLRIPLSGYLAHTNEEVHKALQGDLRVGDGPTVNEAKEQVKDDEELIKLREEKAAKTIEEDVAALKAAPERLLTPSVVIGGKVYTGATHPEAFVKAAEDWKLTPDELVDRIEETRDSFDSFLTTHNRVVSRNEAYDIAVKEGQVDRAYAESAVPGALSSDVMAPWTDEDTQAARTLLGSDFAAPVVAPEDARGVVEERKATPEEQADFKETIKTFVPERREPPPVTNEGGQGVTTAPPKATAPMAEEIKRREVPPPEKAPPEPQPRPQEKPAEYLDRVMDEIKTKPGANISRLAALLGPKLYGDPVHLSAVSVKEMLQNSFDAVKTSLQRGDISKGKIDITMDKNTRAISIKDNGSGMTSSVLGKEFLEIAGSKKETENASGGLGIAKMLFLFGNRDLKVTTVRDGTVSTLETTGSELFTALNEPEKAPSIQTRLVKYSDLKDFPEGHGTRVEITVPKEFKDASTGEMREIKFDDDQYYHTVLNHSPLFANIDVSFNGRQAYNIGSTFPIENHTQFANINFDWGTARIYVSKEPDRYARYGENAHVLSNGLWQFSVGIKKDPTQSFGENVNRTFHIDVSPRVRPEDAGYPFDLNRQNFTRQAGSDFQRIFNYVSMLYREMDFANEAASFGDIEYLSRSGGQVVSSGRQVIKPEKPRMERAASSIREGDKVEVKDGKLIVNNREVPELTKEDLEKGKIDFDALTIPQENINPNSVMLHDNVDVALTPYGGQEVMVPITKAARQLFGSRFDELAHDVGTVFLDLRNAVVDVMGPDYADLSNEAVGISFDPQYRGVSIRIPFRGSFVNIAGPEYSDVPRAGFGMVGTMTHELAHFKVRSHNADFPAEMQRLNLNLKAAGVDLSGMEQEVISALTKNQDVFDWLVQALAADGTTTRGSRFRDSAYQTRPPSGPKDVGDVGPPAGPGDAGVSSERETGERAGREPTPGELFDQLGLGELGPRIDIAPRAPAIQPDVSISSRFSLDRPRNVEGDYNIVKDGRVVGTFKASLDPADTSTIKVSGVDVPEPVDRPGAGDIRKLLNELQKDFPTATHVQGERIGGSRMGSSSPRTRIPNSTELIRRQLYLEPLFQDAKAAGMTQEQFRLYSKNLKDYQEAVTAKKREALEANFKRENKELSKSEREKAEKEFDSRPVIMVEDAMKEAGIKLDAKMVDKNSVPKGLVGRDGLPPDDVAGALGYNSGAELLRDLEGLHQDRAGQSPKEYRESYIKDSVKRNTPAMPDFAEELFSEPLSKLLHEDLRALLKQSEGTEPINLAELQASAKRQFEEMPVIEASNLRYWTNLVKENGKKAELALLRKDPAKAFTFKSQQLANHLIAAEAVKFNKEFAKPIGTALRSEARAQREAARQAANRAEGIEEEDLPEAPEEVKSPTPRRASPTTLVKRYAKKTLPNVNVFDPEYTAQIQGVLMQHGIRLERPKAELEKATGGKDLREFVKEKNQQGANIQVADFVYNSKFAETLDAMTVKRHRDLFDSIRSLDHNSRTERMVKRGQEETALEDFEKEAIASLSKLPSRYNPKSRDPSKTPFAIVYWLDALNVKPEQMFMDMDGRDPQGPFTRAIIQPLMASKHWENDLHVFIGKEFAKLPRIRNATEKIANVPFRNSLTRDEKTAPDGYPYNLNKLDVMMIAAQLGNEKSARAVVSTLYGGPENYSPGAELFVRDWVEKILTPRDWEFVEGLWRIYGLIKPLADDMDVKTSGVLPDTDMVAQPWNGHSGGYFPILLDPWSGQKTAVFQNSPYENDYIQANTARGYTKGESTPFAPVKIVDAYNLVPSHMRGIIHDIAYREALNQAKKILSRPKILQAMNQYYGPEYTNQIDHWLQHIANNYNQNDALLGHASRLLAGIRRNLIVSTLAYNAKVLITPNAGPLIQYLGLHPLKAFRMMFNSELHGFAMQNSGEILHRMENTDRDLREVLTKAMGTQSTWKWMRSEGARMGMYLPVLIDRELMIIAWNEEYARAMSTGKTYFYRDKAQVLDHAQAVEAADALVRRFFGSNSPVDLPGVMRMGEIPKLLFTVFHGFMNAMYQNTRDVIVLGSRAIRRLKAGDAKGARSDGAQMLSTSFKFILFGALMSYFYYPDDIDKQIKKGEYGKAAFGLLTMQLFGIVPGLRDIGAALFSNLPSRPSPIVQPFIDAQRAANALGTKGSEKDIRAVLQLMGTALGVPGAAQFGRSAQYLWNVSTGHDVDKRFSDWWRGLIYGKAKKK